jgi:hypothetical protein
LTLWTYWKFDRPPKPTKGGNKGLNNEHAHHGGDVEKTAHDAHAGHKGMNHQPEAHGSGMKEMDHSGMDHSMMDHSQMDHSQMDHSKMGHTGHAAMHGGANRSMFAIVTIAVCHCGSGCLLGDIVGEWIVFGTNVSINGRGIWVEFLLGKSRNQQT